MTRDQFRIVQKYYDTNSLTYIFYLDTIIGYVEVYSDLYYLEVEKDNWKSQKKKRKPRLPSRSEPEKQQGITLSPST